MDSRERLSPKIEAKGNTQITSDLKSCVVVFNDIDSSAFNADR
jgi:hypothetical protein